MATSRLGSFFEQSERIAHRVLLGEKKPAGVLGFAEAAQAQLATREAVKNNPEKAGTATTMLAGCYLAYGPEKCDIQKMGRDAFPFRLEKYLRALNDWLSMKSRLQAEQPNGEAITLLQNELKTRGSKMEEYFSQTVAGQKEATRRTTLKTHFETAVAEVTCVEEELNERATALQARSPDAIPKNWPKEYSDFSLRRKLVNAINIVLSIEGCVDADLFKNRTAESKSAFTLETLAKKYDWIINPEFDDRELTDDEKKARMLFFGTMSAQAVNDKKRFKHDRTYGNWKGMTYLTEVLHMDPKHAGAKMDEEATQYAALAEKYGLSKLVTLTINEAMDVSLNFANLTATDAPTPTFDKALAWLSNKKGSTRQSAELLAKQQGLKIK